MSNNLIKDLLRAAIVAAALIAIGVSTYVIVGKLDRGAATRGGLPVDGPPPLGPDNPPSPESFYPVEAVSEQPPVTEFDVVPAGEVGERIHDDELVVGVEIDGQARAYSINTLTGPQREIFNDRLAGRAIAATW